MSEFSDELNLLKSAGATDEELKKHQSDTSQLLSDSGASEEEIKDYLGIKISSENENVTKPMTEYFSEVASDTADFIGKKLSDAKTWAVGEKSEFWDEYIKKGFGQGLTNVVPSYFTGKEGAFVDIDEAFKPESKDTGHIERWAASMATITSDLPGYLIGGVIGNRLSGGNPYASGYGAGFVNEKTKAMFLEAIDRGDVNSFSEWWEIFVNHGWKEGNKAGLTLSVAMGLPGTLGVQNKLMGKYLTQYGAFIGMNSILEQKLPTKDELINTALVLGTFGGLEGAGKGYKMVKKRSAETNKSPAEIVHEVLTDPRKKEDVFSSNIKEFREPISPTEKVDSYSDPLIKGKTKEITDPKKASEKELYERFDELSEIVTKAEKPTETLTPELKDMLLKEGGGGEKFSKERGYTEKEIREYEQYKEVAVEIDRRFGTDTAITRELDLKLNREKAQETKPDSTEYFEQITDKPANTKKVGNNQPEINNLEISQSTKKILGFVSTRVPKTNLPGLTEFKTQLTTMLFDKLHPIYNAVKTYEKAKGKFPEGTLDPYKQMRIQPGMENRAVHFTEYGTLDFKSLNNNGASLKKVLEPIKDLKDLAEAEAYLIAKRVKEKEGQGIKTGFPMRDINATIKEHKAKYGKLQKEIYLYQERIVQYLVEGGLFSKEQAAKILEANKDYVPFYKVLDPNLRGDKSNFGTAVKNPFKRFKETEVRTEQMQSPLEAIYNNTMHHVVIAERNYAFTKLIKMIEAAPEQFPYVKRVKGIKATKIEVKEMEKAFDTPIKPDFAEGITVFRKNHSILNDTQIAIYRNGKREVWEVGKELGAALKNSNRYEANLLLKFISIPSKLLRAGATLAPDFMLRNYGRDAINSGIMSERGFIPFVNSTMGFVHMIKQDKVYQEWVKSGGMQSTMISFDRNYFSKDMKKWLTAGKVRNQISSPLEMLRIYADLFESVSRIGNMKLTHQQLRRRKGELTDRDIRESAGFEGRDISIDYSKIGTAVQGLNMITSFFNARLQGYARLTKAFKERPGPTSWQVFKWITLPSIALWLKNHNDERYKKLAQWEKDLFWIVITPEIGIGDAVYKDDNDYTVYRIPKPFEPGLLFGTLPERILDYMYEKNGEELIGFVKGLFNSNLSGLAPIPDAAKPFFESWSNRSLFTKLPIIPYGTEKFADLKMPEYQYNEYTSETAKVIGNTLSQITGGEMGSPARIDSIIQNWTGTLGQYAVQASDYSLRKFGLIDAPEPPSTTLEDLPVIKAFMVRAAKGSSSYVEKFYTKSRQSAAYNELLNKLKKEGNVEAINKLISRTSPKILLFTEPLKAMSQIRKVIRNTYNDKSMSAVEKRQLIDQMYETMIDLSKDTLEQYDAME